MATTDLGKWMITNGGDYDPDVTYEKLTMVMYDNSTYITLKTVTGVTPSNDQINYALMARGFDPGVLSSVTAVDTSGALGNAGETVSAQSLVDYLADAVMTKLVEKANISNVQVNDTSKVPSAALAYAMQQQITENEEAITGLNSDAVKKINNASDFSDLNSIMKYSEVWNNPFLFGLDWNSALSPDGSASIGIMTRNGVWAFTHTGNAFYSNALDSSPNEWKSINKGIFTSRNSISNNTDMNDIKTPGLYSLNGATGLTHIPADLAYAGSTWYGLVFVFKRSDGAIMQLVIATGTNIQYGIGYRNISSNLWCLTNVTWMES